MKTLKNLVAVCFILIFVAGCGGGKGIETTNPEPLENANLSLMTQDGFRYSLVTDAKGEGTVTKYDSTGAFIESVAVTVGIVEGKFTATVTFLDNQKVVIKGTVEDDGTLTNVTIEVNNSNVTIIVIINNYSGSSGGGSSTPTLGDPYYFITSVNTITIYGLSGCAEYTVDTDGAENVYTEADCDGDLHILEFESIVYSPCSYGIESFNANIDGYAQEYYSGFGCDMESAGPSLDVYIEEPVYVEDATEIRGVAWDGSNIWVLDNYNARIFKVDVNDGSTIGPVIALPDCVGCRGLEWDGSRLWTVIADTDSSTPDYLVDINTGDGSIGENFIELFDSVASVNFADSLFTAFKDDTNGELFSYADDGSFFYSEMIEGIYDIDLKNAAHTFCDGKYWFIDTVGNLRWTYWGGGAVEPAYVDGVADLETVTDVACNEYDRIFWLASNNGSEHKIFRVNLDVDGAVWGASASRVSK